MNLPFWQKSFLVFLLLILGIGVTVSTIDAQYFGRNKVQYESFDFKVMKTKHFDIYFYAEEQEAAMQAARLAERWYARLSRIFNHKLRNRQPLILYSSSSHFQQTTTTSGIIGEGTGGFTEMFKRRVVLPMGASLAETDHVIGHELVHAFQFDMTSNGRSGLAAAAPTALRLPGWFIEGLAEYLSIGPEDAQTAMWMRDASYRKKIPTIEKMVDTRYFPYRYGHALWAYICGKWGDGAVSRLMRAISRTGDYETGLRRALNVSAKDLSEEWHQAMNRLYVPLSQKTKVSKAMYEGYGPFVLPVTATEAEKKANDSPAAVNHLSKPVMKDSDRSALMSQLADTTSRILIRGTEENRLNISPSISPDGKRIIFLSTKDLFSIDMYLADAETGKFERRIVKTAANPHFESLGFVKSSGSWDSEGKRIVFGAVVKGKPVLSIINIKKGEEREISFPEFGEILNPTWSPDGRFIAFSAQSSGFSDLFIYDVENENLKRITNDIFAYLQAAWSPDGRTIALVTDKFSTDASILNVGKYEIALLDPETGEMERLPCFSGAKNISPQWSPDSGSLYFISDRSGISNIYKIDLESQNITQITNCYTGITGLTAQSPALSVAQHSGRLVYCLYENDNYNIYSLDSYEPLAVTDRAEQFGEVWPSVLPPRTKPEGELLGLLKNPLYGLPDEDTYKIGNYKPKLKLDYISPPQLGIGVDRWGTYGGGGMSLFFSDMLGYHSLVTMFQVSTRLQDSAALVGYQNSRRRFNWGAVAQRIPYIYGGYYGYIGSVYGEPAEILEEVIYRQVNYQLSGFAAYPLSQVKRLELAAGYRYIDFSSEVRITAYSLISGFRIINEKEKLPAPDGLHFAFAGAALVYDNSYFGATSPLYGQSYILEVSPSIGTIDYFTVLADYRRYFMLKKPFTLAARLLHYGRYGKGAEDSRFYPLFMGYGTLVRGYSYGSFGAGEDDIYARLFGSKMIVGNIELRFPLFGLLGIGRGFYGILPVEALTFFDAGIAWWDEEGSELNPWFLGGDRKPLSSAGLGLRMNLFGYLILGFNYVYPFNRPEEGWHFEFAFWPGF
jgi:Tol biopolymer transport system component